MGRLCVTIPDTLEHDFRMTGGKVHGSAKDSLRKSLEEALKDFIKKHEKK